MVLLVAVGHVVYAIPLPGHPLGYLVAFLLGMTSLFAIGLIVAAIAPSNRVATAIAIPMFFAVMFLGGVYFPRVMLPEVLVRIGDYTPPGVQGAPGRVARHGAAAGAAPRHGGRHGRARRDRRPVVPVGVTVVWRSPVAAAPAWSSVRA